MLVSNVNDMTLKAIGTFDLRDDLFKKIGQVCGIEKHTGSIEVDVSNYSAEDLGQIWKIIGERTTTVEVCDLEDGILYLCDIYGTQNLYSGGDIACFSLRVRRIIEDNDDTV